MRQRYFSSEPLPLLNNSNQFDPLKQDKKLRSNGSVTKIITKSIATIFDEQSDTIGNYKIDKSKQIGSGYSSKVYKAMSKSDSQQYAVKVISIKKMSASSLQMLDSQIKILKNLNHPNIIKCYDVFKSPTHCYIVTEYCQNGDLQTYMTRKGILSQQIAIQIISEIAEGLKYLLKHCLLHRDLKPANILRAKNNWKIADFGFVIQSANQITTKHNVGTPLYMPPQALIKNLYSPQSDIFSIGIMLYQLLIGVTPWQCSSQKQLIRRLSTIPFKIPSKHKINSHIQNLLQKLCAVSLSQRMSKQQFLDLNFNNFKSLDYSQAVYNKKSQGIVINSVKNKLKSKSKSKRSVSNKKQLIKVTSKQQFAKIRSASKQKNEYQIIQTAKRKKGSDQTLIKSKTKKTIKNVVSQTIIEGQNTSENIHKLSNNKLQSDKSRSPSTDVQIKFDQQLSIKNNRILINQLQYCRFMYYLIKNIGCLEMCQNSQQKVSLALFKHIVKLVKQLADSRVNWFGFINWDSFKNSKRYKNTQTTVLQYCQRYQKQYLSFIKNAEISVVRQVNQSIPQISSNENFSITLYTKILQLIIPIIRQLNHNLLGVITSQLISLDQGQKAQLQGLNSLYKYYKMISVSIKYYQNYSYFQQNCEVQFIKKYGESAIGASIYFKLREELKYL